MPDRVAELALQLAAESGALAIYVLWAELAELAGEDKFTCVTVCEHAKGPPATSSHHAKKSPYARLRRAIEAACGELSPRKLGKLLAKWEGVWIGSMRVDCVADHVDGILWRMSYARPNPDNGPTDDETALCSGFHHHEQLA